MPKHKPLYSVHPGVAMIQKWIAELKAKSGRSLDEWIKHIKKEGPETEAHPSLTLPARTQTRLPPFFV